MPNSTSKALVDDFVSSKSLAVVGASRNSKKFGNLAYRELKAKGYRVFPVNPNVDHLGDDVCYPSLKALPEKVDGVVIVVPPKETEKVVQEAAEAGITRVWMQQGAESKEAVKLCEEKGLSEVHGECIMMFAGPVNSVHRIHRGIRRIFSKLPR